MAAHVRSTLTVAGGRWCAADPHGAPGTLGLFDGNDVLGKDAIRPGGGGWVHLQFGCLDDVA